MPSEVEDQVRALVERFTKDVVELMLDAPPRQILAMSTTIANGVKPLLRGTYRKSSAEMMELSTKMVAIIRRKYPDGASAQEIKKELGLKQGKSNRNAFAKPLNIALREKRLKKRGKLRDMRYYAT